MILKTPVAFIIFNRPDLTRIVFESIRKVQPKKLLVIADGARFPEEETKCNQAREIINKVDWDCEVLTNFSDVNLGCKKRVSSGLDWVFSQVEEAIVLEDDCLPAESFFYFCQELLKYYKNDKRIMHISGNNFQHKNQKHNNQYSYYFSKYSHIWGWATWKRAWQYYDVKIQSFPIFKSQKLINFICKSTDEQNYWLNIFDEVFNENIDTWDVQWLYSCWTQNGLSILPKLNLVSNIGFRADATHTIHDSYLANIPIFEIWNIENPKFIVINQDADGYTFKNNFSSQKKSIKLFLQKKILSFLKYFFYDKKSFD